MKRFILLAALAGALFTFIGCSTEPDSDSGKKQLSESVQATVQQLELSDPTLQDFLAHAYAYAIFPSVGKGGLLVGGAYGRGEVYQGNAMIGYADLSQASLGLQIGGQTFVEIVAFEDSDALDTFQRGKTTFTANASAVALKKGAAKATKYDNGVAVFVDPRAGLMVEASLGGQSFSYVPLENNSTAAQAPITAAPSPTAAQYIPPSPQAQPMTPAPQPAPSDVNPLATPAASPPPPAQPAVSPAPAPTPAQQPAPSPQPAPAAGQPNGASGTPFNPFSSNPAPPPPTSQPGFFLLPASTQPAPAAPATQPMNPFPF